MHNLNAVLLAAEMEPRLFDLDFQLLADSLLTIIAVFVLFIALSYLLFNPARKFMQDRQNKIAGELDHAKTAQEDAEKLKADYEARLANVDKEADEILSAARAKALANEADIVAKAREEASRIIAHAHVEAELEKKKAADDALAAANSTCSRLLLPLKPLILVGVLPDAGYARVTGTSQARRPS